MYEAEDLEMDLVGGMDVVGDVDVDVDMDVEGAMQNLQIVH